MAEPFVYGKYTPCDEKEKNYLKNYNPDKYRKISNTADIAVFAASGKDLYLLLVKRGNYPYKGRWCLPGGFVTPGESLETTAMRELKEETGISGLNVFQVKTYSEPGREPRDNSATTLYAAYTDMSKVRAAAGDDAEDTCWYRFKDYRKTESVDGLFNISYVLYGSEIFTPLLTASKGSIRDNKPDSCIIEDTGGIAFDHARLIADAYQYFISG